ncbi:MAG: LapA family protein [Candidatus Omnitrophota bacterium]
MNWKLVCVLALLILLVIFTAQNYELIEIHFLFWSFQTSRAIIIFVSMCIGVIIGWSLSYLRRDSF